MTPATSGRRSRAGRDDLPDPFPPAGPAIDGVRSAHGAKGAHDPRRSAEDRQASDLLLAFTRLLRGHRHDKPVPKRLQALLASGYLAPRHIAAFAVVALEGPLTVSQLAGMEGLAVSTASLLVTQLSEAGLVERREDSTDRRRTVVSVAPEHRRESRAVLESTLAPLRRAIARMGPERTAALLEGLAILVDEVTGTTPGSPGSPGSPGPPGPPEEPGQ